MKKNISLIRTCLKDNMSIFKIKSNKKWLPYLLVVLLIFSFYYYYSLLMDELVKVNLEFVLLTIAILLTSILTFFEGLYKSSGLLFNCKDDNLLLSLPISKSTVFFVRVLKFYIFEMLYNSLFLIPALMCYATYVKPSFVFYIISVLALILLPIIPIVLSSIFGIITSFLSSKFKNKKIMQTIFTFAFVVLIYALSFKYRTYLSNISEHAESINSLITKIYYPAGIYLNLITKFNILDLIKFILVNIIPFILLIVSLNNIYYKINSRLKVVSKNSINSKTSELKIKSSKKEVSFLKKEINKLINTPVYILNSCFGLLIYICLIFLLIFKQDTFSSIISSETTEAFDINKYIILVEYALVMFTSLLTSITCSIISLEGKSFNTLKTLPLKPFEVIKYKAHLALIIESPILLLGTLGVIIKFKINLLASILLILLSIVYPLISGYFGIIINLKYPKLDFKDDTEAVKQSVSSLVAVMGGILIFLINVFIAANLSDTSLNNNMILLIMTTIAILILILLKAFAKYKSTKDYIKLVS